MTVFNAVILATLHFKDNNLVAFNERFHHFCYYFCTIYDGCTNGYCSFFVNKQNLFKFNSRTSFNIFHVMNKKLLTSFCLKLLTVNFYDCVH